MFLKKARAYAVLFVGVFFELSPYHQDRFEAVGPPNVSRNENVEPQSNGISQPQGRRGGPRGHRRVQGSNKGSLYYSRMGAFGPLPSARPDKPPTRSYPR